MNLFGTGIDIQRGLTLAARVHSKYAPVFDRLNERDRAALALYFLPHNSQKDLLEVTRPRVVKWYCPFADQRVFPSGHRYCVNVYTGCDHACDYCYASGYVAAGARCKSTFRAGLLSDLEALEDFDVPPAPLHISNSTDPLQPLEQVHRHTLFALQSLAKRRHRFTTVTLLTKNPAALLDEPYLQALRELGRLAPDHPAAATFEAGRLPPLRVECSLAFFRDEPRSLLDSAAPSVQSRIQAIRSLRNEGVPVVVRIDPLFPRDPLPGGRRMADFGLPDVQSLADIRELVQLARDVGALHVVYSTAKITRPRAGRLSPLMQSMKAVYERLASPSPLVFRGGSWRLPEAVARDQILKPLLDICQELGVKAYACKDNLIATP